MTVKRMTTSHRGRESTPPLSSSRIGLARGAAPQSKETGQMRHWMRDMRVEIAMMRTPDGHSRLEISRFLAPPVVADHRAPR